MRLDRLKAFALSLPHAMFTKQWGNNLVFKVAGKMFLIVTIDESSFAELGTQWPFPRAMHGELPDRISRGRPLVIGIDLIFDTPSSRGPRDDEALGAAVAGAVGHVISEREPDGHMRRGLTALQVGAQTLVAFGTAVHRIARGAGLPAAPVPRDPSFLINFRGGPHTFSWVSYYQVLRGEVRPEAFRGKIVLIGTTSPLLHDAFATPFARSGDMPGVEILANTIATLVQGDRIREVPGPATAAATVLVGLTIGILVARVPGAAVPAALILLAFVTIATFACFALFGAWFRPVGPGLALVVSLVLSIVAGEDCGNEPPARLRPGRRLRDQIGGQCPILDTHDFA